jgi:hypothetical protein
VAWHGVAWHGVQGGRALQLRGVEEGMRAEEQEGQDDARGPAGQKATQSKGPNVV